MKKIVISLLVVVTLNACSFSRDTPAPVVNVTAVPTPAATRTSLRKPRVAAINPIAEDNGTQLSKINTNDEAQVVQAPDKPVKKKTTASAATTANTAAGLGASATLGGLSWLIPTEGKIVAAYTPASKGVDVSGKEGQPILAAAAGKVVYSGNGLKGYGNLIILKHQDNYLTAYSHNKVNFVKEGQLVKRGQKIAELGKTDSEKPIMHFELRQSGKPLNPTKIFNQ